MTIDDCKIIYRGSKASRVTVAESRKQRNLYMDGDILQSSMLLSNPADLYLEYSQAMMCALLFLPVPKNVLLVGLGGGSLVRFLLEFCPDVKVDVAEINPEVIHVARKYFLLTENKRLRIINSPGEVVVEDRLETGESYDLILLDAFDDKGPSRALLEEHFLTCCRKLLTKKGIFAMNLWKRPVDNFPSIFDALSMLFEQRIHKLFLDDTKSNAIVFGFNELFHTANLMGLKRSSRELSKRTGINFTKWLRQIYWQNI